VITWADLKSVKIPILEFGAILGLALTGLLWADDIEDKQIQTQKQLDQLVTISTESAKENAKIHKAHNKSLTSIETSLALMAQEVRLRRELEKERENPSQ